MSYKKPTAIDLFSGCGGLSLGLRTAGYQVVAAVEIDPRAAATYKLNHPRTRLIHTDIRVVNAQTIAASTGLKCGALDLLAGCPPCQGFSTLRTRKQSTCLPDSRNDLIREFSRLIDELRPVSVMLENVPALEHDLRFKEFRHRLEKLGYFTAVGVLNVATFGVAQRRNRLILIASRIAKVKLLTSGAASPTVRETIAHLANVGLSGDELHDLGRQHSPRVQAIIRAIPKDGGSRASLPKELILDCHRRTNGFTDVYGRMAWDGPAPTITSGCTNPSKGRFIHPEEDRAITLREAAMLQGFPKHYKFNASFGIQANALMIGNALPPPFIAHHARLLREQTQI
jgi:DNA (cytosine-5)-methyltransferase 1